MNKLILLATSFVFFVSACGTKTQPAPTEEWTQLASMPTARSENVAAVVDQTIYVSGGFGGEKKLEASTDIDIHVNSRFRFNTFVDNAHLLNSGGPSD